MEWVENIVVSTIFSFSHNVFYRLFSPGYDCVVKS